MMKPIHYTKLMLVGTLLGLGLVAVPYAHADDSALEVLKDRLRGASTSVVKEAEEFYDEILSRPSPDREFREVRERTASFLAATRHFKRRVRKLASVNEAHEQVQNLQVLWDKLKPAIEQSALYRDERVQHRWHDVVGAWSTFRSIL